MGDDVTSGEKAQLGGYCATSGCACAHSREPPSGHVTSCSPAQWHILYYYYTSTKCTDCACARDDFGVRSRPLSVTWLPVTSLPVMWLPVAPHCSTANMVLAVLIYYYRGTKEIFFTLVILMKIENTFSFQLDVADLLLLVLMKLELNLLFNDLARRFGISKGLDSRMYNSWMPASSCYRETFGSPFEFSTAKHYRITFWLFYCKELSV